MPSAAICSHAGASSARKAATTRSVTALGTTLRYIARCSAAKSNSARMRARGSPSISAVAEREGDGECVRDRVVAVAEVSVEDLAADLGAVDDVAHRQIVDRTLVRQCERGVAKLGADSFGAGIDTIGACCHNRTIAHFVDK